MFEQRTIRSEVVVEGRGLHSGRTVRTRIRPAPADSGVVFVRTDQGGHTIPARREFLQDTRLSTTLSRNGLRVGTVEHLLAALAGLGVDNARVELDGPEVPILDGSAAPFVEILLEAGMTRQRAHRRFITPLRPLSVSDGDKRLVVFPANELRVTYAIDFSHPAIGYQEREFRISSHSFMEEIAPARTFCLYRDVEAMRRQGLAMGGSLDNAVVVGDDGIMTGSLRYPDEFVRHKVLDLLGDLALLGMPIRGHLVAFKGGHGLHASLVSRILATPDAWTISRGQDSLPRQLVRSFEREKEAVLPALQPALA